MNCSRSLEVKLVWYSFSQSLSFMNRIILSSSYISFHSTTSHSIWHPQEIDNQQVRFIQWNTVGGIEYRTFHIFFFSDPYLVWNIWFEAPSLLPAKWQCQNSHSEGNFIKKCLISEHFIIPSWEEKSSIFS